MRTSVQYQNGYEGFIKYYLNSSVLGLAVAKLDSSGQRVESYVYAGRRKLATATPWQLIRSHVDPVTGSHGQSASYGGYGADAEFNADGVDIGFAEPTQEEPEFSGFKYPEVAGGAGCYPGNPNCVTCFMDGFEQNCAHVGHLMSLGFAQQCPDNDCGPRHDPNRDGLGRGGWIIPRLFPGGFEFEPLGPSSRPPGLARPTLKTVSPEEAARRRQVVRDFGWSGFGNEGGDPFPQDPWQRGILANFEKCLNKYLPEVYPEGKPKPDDLNIGLAMYGGLDDTNNSAMILALWAKESSFELRPRGDHGPLELTSWWKDYSDRNGLNLIVPGSYDPFGRPAGSANRNRTFTGTISANVMTGGNIIRYSQSTLHQSDRSIAYNYGPGSGKSAKDNVKTRNEYANHAMRLKDRYVSLINCLKTGQ